MELLNQTIKSYLEAVDSKMPAPGGGSASALTGSVGVALGRMVGHLTIDRKQFRQLDEETKQMYINNFALLKKIRLTLMECIQKNPKAFTVLLEAFKLPKDTEEEIEYRKKAIKDATEKAITVPMNTAKLSIKALKLIKEMMPFSHKHAISDIGISALLLSTAVESSILNIKINLVNLLDEDKKAEYHEQIKALESTVSSLKKDILKFVEGSICQNCKKQSS